MKKKSPKKQIGAEILVRLGTNGATLRVSVCVKTKGRMCLSNLWLQNESPGSPLQLNQLRTVASDTGLMAVTHALISNGCLGAAAEAC